MDVDSAASQAVLLSARDEGLPTREKVSMQYDATDSI